jgi:hypothetical protein
MFVAAMVWLKAYPLFPKPGSRKWSREEAGRAAKVGVAVSKITGAVFKKNLLQTELHEICLGLLSAVKSEVEAMTGDKEGLYFNVSLLVEDPDDNLRVKVFARVDQNRQNNSYIKKELLIEESFRTRKSINISECKIEGRPYRSIFGYPLFSSLSTGMTFLGVVTIDSSEPHHFDGIMDAIDTKLLPYISLLKLAIIADKVLGERRRRNGR